MKNLISMVLVVFIIFMTEKSNAQNYPIPSYDVTIIGKAVFLERIQSCPEAQKMINVRKQCVGFTTIPEDVEPPTRIYIFSKDGINILGPYYLSCGETFSVPVDDREWGVLVDTDVEVYIDVWITYE